jgi:hypothetical protein
MNTQSHWHCYHGSILSFFERREILRASLENVVKVVERGVVLQLTRRP